MPVLAIALDTADRRLMLDPGLAADLPVLTRLVRAGATVPLRSPADYFPEAVWPTLATGCGIGEHGHYNVRCVRPGSYSLVPAPARSHRRSFWELLPECGLSGVMVDVPYSEPLGDDRMVQVVGWGSRNPLRSESWPPELFGEVLARHGPYPHWLDEDFDRSPRARGRHLAGLLEAIDLRATLVGELLRDSPWDLALAVCWETHNAGHVFHRYLDPASPAYDPRGAARFSDALLEVYRRADRALGHLIAQAPVGTQVVVFSPYGLRANTNGLRVLPELLTRLSYTVATRPRPVARLALAARSAFPWAVRRHVNARLSLERRMWLMERMWAEATDWPRTRAVAESEFGYGWVRVNLRGREPQGIVEAGGEYESLCERIARDIRALTDAETGEPAVAEVVRARDLFAGPHADELPDLLVRWAPDRLLRSVRHPRAGVIDEDLRDVAKTEHRGEGFLVAAGPGIRAGVELETADVVDLAPTFLHLVGAPVPEAMNGRVLSQMIEPAALEAAPIRRRQIPWERDRW